MLKIFVGSESEKLILKNLPSADYLLIHDEVPELPYAQTLDLTLHSIDPFEDLDYFKACDFIDIISSLFPKADDTLTKDTGLDFVGEMLKKAITSKKPVYLNTLIPEPRAKASIGHIWAYNKIQRLLRSPVLKNVLCNPSHTKFPLNPKSVVLARINRTELRDFDALSLGLFLSLNFKGHVVIPAFDFYGRNAHMSLIRDKRLTGGIQYLDQLPLQLRQSALSIPEKVIKGALYDDAVELAKHAGLRPDPMRDDNEFNKFVDNAMSRT